MDPHWPGCGILFSLSNRFLGWVRLVKRSWENMENMEKHGKIRFDGLERLEPISSWCYKYCFANSWANNGQLWPMAGFPNCKDPLILAERLHFRPCRHWKTTMSRIVQHRWVFVSRVSSSRVSRVAQTVIIFTPLHHRKNAMMMMPTEDLICTGCGFLAKIKWMMDGGGKVVSKKNPKAASEMRHNILK